jgi:peptide/nickel transport system ATP-binding protein
MDRTRQERLRPIPGQPPSLIRVPSGCVFHPRCQYKDNVPGNRCVTEHPELLPVDSAGDHTARCHIDPDKRRKIFTDVIAPGL